VLWGLVFVVAVVPAARVRSAQRRREGRLPRILWGPIPIVNIHYASRGDRGQGLESESLVYDVYSINASELFDHVVELTRRPAPVRVVAPYAISIWAALRFDVFCFFFDGGLLYSTPFWRAELALLRLAGRRIVVMPYGGDARLRSTTEKIRPWNLFSDVGPEFADRRESDVRDRLAAFGRYAHVMLGCADLAEDLPRVDGIFRYPFAPHAVEPRPRDDGSASVVVVHAPNHRHYKGTHYLEEAVRRLRGEGLPVELDLVERVPNAEALARYAAADIVADQFLAGAYAMFAIEGMSFGKPVICYLNDRFRPWHPEWAECPIVSASPDELVDALRLLVADPGLRDELGKKGPPYVEKYHSLESVGRDMRRFYERAVAVGA
jgi:glycosyltransferase involved in cell wall biosynthesis